MLSNNILISLELNKVWDDDEWLRGENWHTLPCQTKKKDYNIESDKKNRTGHSPQSRFLIIKHALFNIIFMLCISQFHPSKQMKMFTWNYGWLKLWGFFWIFFSSQFKMFLPLKLRNKIITDRYVATILVVLFLISLYLYFKDTCSETAILMIIHPSFEMLRFSLYLCILYSKLSNKSLICKIKL